MTDADRAESVSRSPLRSMRALSCSAAISGSSTATVTFSSAANPSSRGAESVPPATLATRIQPSRRAGAYPDPEAVAQAAGFGVLDRAEIRVRSVAFHEPVFPLHNHSQMLIVEQQNFDREVFAVASGQFLDVHLETAVAIDVNAKGIGMSGLCAHRSCMTP